jgi:hypothetical protein
MDAEFQETTIDQIVAEQKTLASEELLKILREFGTRSFSEVWETLLQSYMLRVTNIKDICVELARTGAIEQTWNGSARKPRDYDQITEKLNRLGP